MRISIGGDHAGPALKKALTRYLESEGNTVVNRGTDSTDSVDYPDHAHAVAADVEAKEVDFGILICGSANGVAMSANKHQGVRAGFSLEPRSCSTCEATQQCECFVHSSSVCLGR